MQPNNTNIILDIQNLSCGYGGKPVIEDFNLQVKAGEVVAIIGPNGCGKSTLLKAIYQLCLINKGSILYNGESLIGKTPEKIKNLGIAYFMQKNSIFPQLSVKENLFLSLNGMSKQQKKIKTEELICNFPDLGSWRKKSSGLLSGGQRQQLAMVMLFAQDADLWLLDEPTAGVNPVHIEQIKHGIRQMVDENKTILLIEHNMNFVRDVANRAANLDEGKIQFEGSVCEVLNYQEVKNSYLDVE